MNPLEKLIETASDSQLQDLIRQFEEQHVSPLDLRVRKAAEKAIDLARGEQDMRALLRELRRKRHSDQQPDQED